MHSRSTLFNFPHYHLTHPASSSSALLFPLRRRLHMCRSLLVLAILLVLLQLAEARKVLFQRSRVPHGWLALRHASPSSPVRFTIGLRGATVDDIADTFWSISDPTSNHYLELLTRHQIDERFGPTAEHRSLVQQWLMFNGVDEVEMRHVSSAIEVRTRAEVAERLFATEMRLFQHGKSGKQVVKAWGIAELPDHIYPAVELVTGLSSFPVPRPSPVRSDKTAVMDPEVVIPQTLRELYQIRPQQSGDSAATQGVIEFGDQYFTNNDTATFAAAVNYDSGNATIQPIADDHIVGDNEGFAGVEATLDVQWMSATNLEAQMWFWVEGGSSWLYEYALHALNTTTVPQVVSISYGLWEGMQCFADAPECELLDMSSDEYTAATNALFMKMGMQGTTIIVASGDSGANSRTDETCAAYNLRPEYPASSPYVTTVGATMVVDATYGFDNVPACQQGRFSCIESGREVAVSRLIAGFTSGGGFSNSTSALRPRYQDSVVQAYLNSGVALPPSSYYNVKGRAEPDVAAVGSLGLIAVQGLFGTVGGTSMSSPIFAGVASLLNEIALNKLGSPLGFLNPLLYKMSNDATDTFHDITEGDNICPEQYCGPNCKGFVATKGWDPVTGLGTPNAARMEAYVTQLMDDVLARRERAASSGVEQKTVSTVFTAKLADNARLYSQRQQPPSQLDPLSLFIEFPNSSHWMSHWLTNKNKASSTLDAYDVGPEEVWTGLTPLAIGMMKNDSLTVALESTILTLTWPTLVEQSNCSIDPSLKLAGFATAGSSLYVLLVDVLYGIVYLNGLDVKSCVTTTTATLKYPTRLLSIDKTGKLALTSTGASEVVWFDTATGERRGAIANSSWSAVTSGAINPANFDVWVSWAVINGRSTTTGIDVVQGNSTRFTVSVTDYSPALIEDVVVDYEGQYSWILYLAVVNQTLQSFVEQLDAITGKRINQWQLPTALQPTTALITRGAGSQVYYMSYNQLVTVSSDGIAVAAVGQYPFIPEPTDVAVTADGTVLVASVGNNQILALNASGQVIVSYPAIEPPCQIVPLLDVAVDYEGNVYMPVCNATIFVFDNQGGLVTQVYTGAGSSPRSVAPGPRNTLFFTDDNNQQQVTQITLDGKIVYKYSAANVGWLFTVKYEWRSQQIAVTDVQGGQFFVWSTNGTDVPYVVNVTAAASQPAEVYSLAIDHTHQQTIVSVIFHQYSALLWFDSDGNLLDKSFTFPTGTAATGVAVSHEGSRVYATDILNNAIYVFHQDEQHIDRVEHRTNQSLVRVATN